jgi:LuxR family maltose regulon positive regulatory protein
VYYLQAKWANSVADAQAVLRLTQQATGDELLTRFRAEAYRILGQNDRLQGNLPQSIDHLSQALKLYQAQADDRGINLLQVSLGATYYESGDFSAAQACYLQALEYHRGQGDLFLESAVLNDLAVLHQINGEYLQAFATFEQALDISRRGSNNRVETMVLIGLGDLFVDLDSPGTALEAYRQARDRLEYTKDHFLEIYQLLAEASAARLQKDFAGAKALLQAAEQLMGNTPLNYTQGLWLLEYGQLALAEKQPAQAREQFAQAALLFEAGDQRILAGRANLLLAGALFALDRLSEAEICLGNAFRTVHDLKSQHVLVCAGRQVKLLLDSPGLSSGSRLRARRLLERVDHFENDLLSLRRALRFQKMEIQLSPPELYIQAFGSAQVLLDNKPVTNADWLTPSTRDLLYLILSEPRGWSKEVLGEILWPGSSPAQLKNRFKNAIYRLRRALRQDVILFDGERYIFNENLDYGYDVERFEQLLARAKVEKDTQARKQIYQEIFHLYQGDYLPEADGDWVLPKRERLRQSFLMAGLQLAALYMDEFLPEQALGVCKRLICSDACLEKAYYLAMQALAMADDRTGVIRLYEELQANLGTELGIAPSIQTADLFRSLIR